MPYSAPIPEGAIAIDTTSRSNTWSRGLSPFVLPAGRLYGSFSARTVENAWQYAKVYPKHLDPTGEVKPEYWSWARAGWNSPRVQRYPMGKGAQPLFSLGDGAQLSYVEARLKVYVPLYARAVRQSDAYAQLVKLFLQARSQRRQLVLRDRDGYDHAAQGLTVKDVLKNPNRSLGHGFVLLLLLEHFGDPSIQRLLTQLD